MNDLGIEPEDFRKVFPSSEEEEYLLIKISRAHAKNFAYDLRKAIRRCYITDERLIECADREDVCRAEVVKSKLPDRGSTMAGDFGEILTSLYQICHEYPTKILDPWKLRLKGDRTKPAPYSDVVQFVLPRWPESSSDDRIICSEVKTKSTKGSSKPIVEAIKDSKKDSERRLPKTIAWLEEKSLDPGIDSVSRKQIKRFGENMIEYPEVNREFNAVAVICSSLVDDEIVDMDAALDKGTKLIIISVPDLKKNYEAVYEAVLKASDEC